MTYALAQATAPGLSGKHLAALLLIIGLCVGWVTWLLGRSSGELRVTVLGLVVLAMCGGGLVGLSAVGVAAVAVAGMGAALALDLVPAIVVASIGVAASAVAVAVSGHSAAAIGGAAIGALAGLAAGATRRQRRERAEQAMQLALAQERTAIEHERAEVLAERNHIAREVHDVLAHTLSALSVQMEALDSLIDAGATPSEVQEAVRRSRGLVVDGLDETRRAVRALRDEPMPVAEQIVQLSDGPGVTCRVDGTPRALTPAAGLALLRVAQEGVTNARKHAPGCPVTVTLHFDDTTTSVRITNQIPVNGDKPETSLDGGYGLRGMRERVELARGTVTAGPVGDNWQVLAEIPA
jgi:signal transduction histidine kinase